MTTPPLIHPGQGLDPADYSLPGVDGIYVRLVWRAVEPAPGRYDWTSLDRILDRALPTGKVISVGVGSGAFTPDWLYTAGAAGGSFTIAPHGGRNGHCRTVRIPAPWSSQYESAFGDLMTALAGHLRSYPGAYKATRIVKITAINEYTEETRMPASSGQGTGGACAESNALATWHELGYRPSKVVQAWKTMAASLARAFPDKLVAMPILERNDFPAINEAGQIVTREDPARTAIKRSLIAAGLGAFPGRFAVQWNGLQVGKVSESVLWAASQGAEIGWQTNEHQGPDGAACPVPGAPRSPCTAAGYDAILTFGLDKGARFVEIWPADAKRFAAAIGRASARLKSKSPTEKTAD